MTYDLTVKAELEHLAIISWPVNADAVAAMLPAPLVPRTIGKGVALVSMALMQDTMLGETFAQLNERTYVQLPDGTGRGAFFWRSQVSSAQALIVRSLVGAPEFASPLRMKVQGDDYIFRRDDKVIARLDLGHRGEVPERHQHLDVDRAARLSSRAPVGYTLNWGRLCATRVLRSRVRARRVGIRRIDPSFMQPAIAIAPNDYGTPLLALYVRRTPFWVDVPRPLSAPRDPVVWPGLLPPLEPL